MYFTGQVGEEDSSYGAKDIRRDLQRGRKSTRYDPGSVNREKLFRAVSAIVMSGSPCSCAS